MVLGAHRRGDGGEGATGYLAATMLVAALAGAIVQSGVGLTVANGIGSAVCGVAQPEAPCRTAAPAPVRATIPAAVPTGGPTVMPTAAPTAAAARQGPAAGGSPAATAPEDLRWTDAIARYRWSRPSEQEMFPPMIAAGGPQPGSPLGAPVSGLTVREPTQPAFTRQDGGSGPWHLDQADPFMLPGLFSLHATLWDVAKLAQKSSPHASRNLLHFLGNSGTPLRQDVDRFLADVPGFAADVAEDQAALGRLAIKRARASRTTEPVTFPVNTSWDHWTQRDKKKDSDDWWRALGGINYNQTGQVTVWPSNEPGAPWRYEVTTRVNLRDPYDWEWPSTRAEHEDHSVFVVMHQWGLARDFLAFGSSRLRLRAGVR
ncbi:hypothetical protein [Actinomadura sp. HBU206391]|uniref:hypothetical protein n=1 Tax=Actinomadura sp. HBU206391 TaxID=2731692 RepID=UPI00164FA4B1|nr:hypothetical protein [Actinomadura sp. HBU206391]MBC6457833.1 hypothetical protein [Actinomadura sp. HBU206391]